MEVSFFKIQKKPELKNLWEGYQLKFMQCVMVWNISDIFELITGQLHDTIITSTTIKHVPVKSVCIADKAFDCDYLIDSCKKKNVEVIIPSKKIE